MIGSEFHNFFPLKAKQFCAVASLNLGRGRWSAVARRVEMLRRSQAV